MTTCTSNSDCNVTIQYCELNYHRCESCSYICHPGRGLKTECKEKCTTYRYKHRTKTSSQQLSLLGTVSPYVPSTMITASFLQDSKPSNNQLLISVTVTLLILVIMLMATLLFILLWRYRRLKHRRKPKRTNDIETSNALLEMQNVGGQCETHETNMTDRNQSYSKSNTHEEVSKPETVGKTVGMDKAAPNISSEKPEQTCLIPSCDDEMSRQKTATSAGNVDNTEKISNICGDLEAMHSKERGIGENDYHISPKKTDTTEASPTHGGTGSGSSQRTFPPSGSITLPSPESRKRIYEYLRRTSWIDGYFSAGKSIEIYVDKNTLTEEWVLTQVTAQTQQGRNLFHVKDTSEQY